MQSRRLRCALIGAGSMASTYHHPSLASLPEIELAAVCELVPEKGAAAANRFGIPRVDTDYRQMLREVDPEVVYVIMPPQHLFEPAAACLAQGRHLFIEKPLGLTTWQARALADLAERRDCRTMVGFQRRHVPALTEIRRRVEARGPIWNATVSFLKCAPLDEPAGLYGGAIDALTSDGIHAVDAVRFLAGGEVLRVAADVRRQYAPGPFANNHTALVTFSSGAVGVLQFHYTTGRRIFRMEFHGRAATGYVDPDREAYFVADNAEPEVRPATSFGTMGGAAGDEPPHWLGFWHEHRHFADAILAGREATSHFGDAVKTMELVERILHEGGA